MLSLNITSFKLLNKHLNSLNINELLSMEHCTQKKIFQTHSLICFLIFRKTLGIRNSGASDSNSVFHFLIYIQDIFSFIQLLPDDYDYHSVTGITCRKSTQNANVDDIFWHNCYFYGKRKKNAIRFLRTRITRRANFISLIIKLFRRCERK